MPEPGAWISKSTTHSGNQFSGITTSRSDPRETRELFSKNCGQKVGIKVKRLFEKILNLNPDFSLFSTSSTGAPCGIRTHGPRIRNPVLYPSELRGLRTNSLKLFK